MSAIYVLWLRELRRYIRSRAQIAASLGQPLLYLVALGFGLGPVFQKAGQGSYVQFVAPGIISMAVLFSSVFSGMGLLWDRQFGFLKETLVAPVPRLHIMLGKTLGSATVAVIQGLLVATVCFIAGFRAVNFKVLPLALLFMVLIACLFSALGTAIGSVLQNIQGFQLIMNFLVMPIFFLSGALYPLNNLPKALSASPASIPWPMASMASGALSSASRISGWLWTQRSSCWSPPHYCFSAAICSRKFRPEGPECICPATLSRAHAPQVDRIPIRGHDPLTVGREGSRRNSVRRWHLPQHLAGSYIAHQHRHGLPVGKIVEPARNQQSAVRRKGHS
jgi:ABC-type multidrug transport system, permease component